MPGAPVEITNEIQVLTFAFIVEVTYSIVRLSLCIALGHAYLSVDRYAVTFGYSDCSAGPS